LHTIKNIAKNNLLEKGWTKITTDGGKISSEAGSSEAGSSEAGSSEAGSSEAGSSEAGSSEAGSSEAGRPQIILFSF
jgi:hypothetical protein